MKISFDIAKLKGFKFISLLRFLPITIIIILIGFFGLTIGFLYKYFYQTIAQAKVVSILKNQVALNQVNVPLFEKVLSAWDAKKQFNSSDLENIRDPFQPLPEISISTPESSLESVNSIE